MIRKLSVIVNKMTGLYYEAASSSGIKANMLDLLYALDDGEVHTQKSICEEWFIPRTTLNTITREAREKGYLTLESIPGRGKERALRLTDQGRKFASSVLNDLYKAEDEAFLKTEKKYTYDFVQAMEDFEKNLEKTIGNRDK